MTYEMDLITQRDLGYQEGFAEGFAEGRAEVKDSIARNMIQMQIDLKTICEVTELPMEKILELEKKLKS